MGWHGPNTTPSQENPSPDDNHPECGDPIDLSSGILVIRETDLEITGGRGRIGLDRTYRSLTTTAGPFGLGTNHTYGYRLSTNTPQGRRVINLIMPNGNVMSFTKHPDGTFSNTTIPAGRGAVMSLTERNEVKLRWKDGTVFYFMPATSALGSVLESITDRNGNQTRLIRSTRSPAQILEVIDPVERKLRLTYDQNDRIVSILDPIGRIVRYTYNSQGTLETVTDPEGGVTRYDYNTQNQLTQITDARGTVVARNTYDANGRVIQQTQADGGVWTFDYELLNPQVTLSPVQQTTVTDPRGNPTTFRFSPQGFVLSRTDALGQTTDFEKENGTNLLLSETDSLGRTTRFTYDEPGNRTAIQDPAGHGTTVEYGTPFNLVTKIIDALKQSTTFTYDTQGNLLTITDPLKQTTTFTYNSVGQPVTSTNPLGHTTTLTYDQHGNVLTMTDPLGQVSKRAYDKSSRLIRLTDQRGFVTQYQYDPLNHLTQMTDAQGGVTRFTYDPNGNLLTLTDAKNQTTTYTYDPMDRLASRQDALGRQETSQYDLAGNLKIFTDRKGQATRFTYDARHRRTGVTYADGRTTSFVFDTQGRLVRAADAATGALAFVYDAFDRVVQETTPQGTVGYRYDAVGRRTQMTVNGQPPITYQYDAAHRLTRVEQGTVFAGLTYDVSGRRKTLAYSNGTTTSYGYDRASRLTNLTHHGPTGLLEALSYTYDAAGNRVSLIRTNGPASRLPPAMAGATYDAANQQIQFDGATPTSDQNGNVLTDGTNTYTWDARNRLVGITGGTRASFVYDVLGRRVQKTINGVTTKFLYDGADIVQERGDGAASASYLRSLRVDEPFVRQGRTEEFYHVDALGSPLALTNSAGAITTTYGYEPYGKTTVTGSSANRVQFTGRENDGTGLYYYRARSYDPTTGRFLSEDPIGLDGGDQNLYRYVKNNPVNFKDPSGLASQCNDCNSCFVICACELFVCLCSQNECGEITVLGIFAISPEAPISFRTFTCEEFTGNLT